MLLDLGDQVDRGAAVALGDSDPQRVVDLGQLTAEDRVDDDALDLDDLADVLFLAVVLVRHVSPGEVSRDRCGSGTRACRSAA